MRSRGLALGSWLTPSAWRQRRPQQRPRHDQPSPVHPTGVFDQPRRDHTPGVCEPSAPALDAGVGFLGAAHRRSAPLAGLPRRATDPAGARWRVGRQDFLRGSDLGWHRPRHRLEGTRGGGRPWPASRVWSMTWRGSSGCERHDLDSAVRAAGAASGVGTRLAGQGTRGGSRASHARGGAVVRRASARAMAAGDETTSPRWAMPSGPHAMPSSRVVSSRCGHRSR